MRAWRFEFCAYGQAVPAECLKSCVKDMVQVGGGSSLRAQSILLPDQLCI